jgi:hypothetical protein
MSNDDERDYAEEHYNARLLDDETDPEDDERDTPRLDTLLSSEGPEEYTPRQFRPPGEGTYTRGDHRTRALADADMARRSDPEFAPGLGFAALTHAVLALSAPAGPAPADEDGEDEPPQILPKLAALLQERQRATGMKFGEWARQQQARETPAQSELRRRIEDDYHQKTADAGSAWRQRAIEAEAALTAIGGILLSGPVYTASALKDIERILRTAGRQADRLPARYRPDTPEGAAWKEGYETAVRNLQGPA